MTDYLKTLSEQGMGNHPVTFEGLCVTKLAESWEGSGQVAISCGLPTVTPTPISNSINNPTKEHKQMETSTPVLPVTVPVNGGYGYHKDGLEGKDAAFLTELHNASRTQDLSGQINRNGFDNAIQSAEAKFQNAIQTLEAKFQTERSIKEVEINTLRTAAEQTAQLNAVRSELQLMIQSEADRTRDLIRALDGKKKDDDMLVLRIGNLLPGGTPTP